MPIQIKLRMNLMVVSFMKGALVDEEASWCFYSFCIDSFASKLSWSLPFLFFFNNNYEFRIFAHFCIVFLLTTFQTLYFIIHKCSFSTLSFDCLASLLLMVLLCVITYNLLVSKNSPPILLLTAQVSTVIHNNLLLLLYQFLQLVQ